MELSIVTSMYYSAPYLQEFCTRVSTAAEHCFQEYEIILVNDGSPDDALDVALTIQERNPRVRIIDLARNFGHHKAVMTGLTHARGALVFLLDCDLEEPPEIISDLVRVLQQERADMVYGVQATRKGQWFERVSGEWFYRFFNTLSSVQVPKNVLMARLMTRRYVDALIAHRDKEVYLLGLLTVTGFKQVPLMAHKLSKGTSTYSLSRKVSLLVNAVTSFSNQPLLVIFYFGLLVSMIAGLAAFALIIWRFFYGGYMVGWPSLIVSIWLLGGISIMCLGVIGIYLGKIFSEVKDRPYTVVRAVYERDPGSPPPSGAKRRDSVLTLQTRVDSDVP
jgi:putative glycosyltransferase